MSAQCWIYYILYRTDGRDPESYSGEVHWEESDTLADHLHICFHKWSSDHCDHRWALWWNYTCMDPNGDIVLNSYHNIYMLFLKNNKNNILTALAVTALYSDYIVVLQKEQKHEMWVNKYVFG